ncbi:hypothetical protein VNI00_007958 [Paramarasmius palmivorus]|uniref:Uncharacterized protein n=1 Tax=Paramarasmius palmivorus TaxID=297713 RepID=A0AAW0CXW4_9AGAR
MSHNSKAKAKGISSSSFFDLKAELAKQEEESRRNREAGKSATIIGGVPRPDKKPTVWARQNKGVKNRAARDMELEAISKPTIESSRAALERKAKIYDMLKKGKSGGLSDAQYEALLVDFDSKGIDSKAESDSEDEASVPIDGQDEIIEYVDELGRTRTLPKSKVPRHLLPKGMDEEAVDEDEVIRNPINHWVTHTHDEERIAQIRKEFSEENNPLDRHYDPTFEVRARGAGQYTFSHDEEKRREEQERLRMARMETEKARAESGAVNVKPGEVEGMVEGVEGIRASKAMEKRKRDIEERRKMLDAKRRKLIGTEEVSRAIPERTNAIHSTPVFVAKVDDDPFAALEASTSKETARKEPTGKPVSDADAFLANLEHEMLNKRGK